MNACVVSTDWLAERLDAPDIVILDASWHLPPSQRDAHAEYLAEHIPGCNMAFRKSRLHEIGGFDPQFRKAGDDVDVCWRLQQQGFKLGFSPAGFVWHFRRATARAGSSRIE